MSYLDTPQTSLPHLTIPFQIVAGSALTVEQDTLDEVVQSVAVLCNTQVGFRVPLPAYGVTDQTFGQTYDTGDIPAAVAVWEPRATVAVTATPGVNGPDVVVNVARLTDPAPQPVTAAVAPPAGAWTTPPPPSDLYDSAIYDQSAYG